MTRNAWCQRNVDRWQLQLPPLLFREPEGWKGHRIEPVQWSTKTEMEKEERRRRIVERGSQRLALITGSIQNLESLPLSPSPKTHHDISHRRIHSAPAVAVHASNGLSLSQDQGHYPSPKQSHLSGTFSFSFSCHIVSLRKFSAILSCRKRDINILS